LEEVLFSATETEARRRELHLDLPLSAVSYALHLAAEHLLPAHAEELDAEARAHGYEDWEGLVQANQRLAATVASSLASDLGLSAALVPSRSERLASLLAALPEGTGLLWLLDDAYEFLASAGPKGSREDLSFLEFLAQRAKVEPLYLVATGTRGAAKTGSDLRDQLARLAGPAWPLAPRDLRALFRLAWTGPDDARGECLEEVVDRYARLWLGPAPTSSELEESYPWIPLALRLFEQAAARVAGVANFALRSLREQAELLAGRPCWRLLSLAEVADLVLDAVPSGGAAEQIRELRDFFAQHAGDLWPQEPELVGDVLAVLLAAQLAGEVLTVSDLVQLLGLDAQGRPHLTPRSAEHVLAAMARLSSAVRQVNVNGEKGYVVVWRLPAEEQARREFERLRASLTPTDRRVEERAVQLLSSDRSPLAEFATGTVVEMLWHNAPRFVHVELVDVRVLGEDYIFELCSRLASPEFPESAAILLGLPFRTRQQRQAWRRLTENLANTPGAEGLALWLPRDATAEEAEPLRTLVACAQAEELLSPLGEEMASYLQQERTLAETTAVAALTATYLQGQVVSIYGLDLDSRLLGQDRPDLQTALVRAADPALTRRHPDFPRLAPRRPVTSRKPLDLLYEKLLQPGGADAEEGGPLVLWVEALLVPMGLAVVREGQIELTAQRSPVARFLLDMLRARDTAPSHEMGRAVDCAETAQVLFKSELGLPPDMFELAAAVLCRLGYLIPLDEEQNPLVLANLPPPFASRVHYLARAPALGPTRWQAIGRLLRATGFQGTIAGDYEGQQHAWDTLVAERQHWLGLLAHLRERLGEVWEALDQGPEEWPETLEELDTAEHLFRLINPEMPAALGLIALADAVGNLVAKDTTFGALANFLNRLEKLADFLDEQADDVIGVYRYLIHPKLNADPESDVGLRRDQLLAFIAGGEAVARDFLTFRRLQQIFFVTYARRYISWHNRAYQSPVFERCAALLNTPDFRALERLGRLNLDVEHDAATVRAAIEEALERRCTYSGLDRALRLTPVCPECGLELGCDPDLPDPDELAAEIARGLVEYTQALSSPEFREQLRKYMAALPRWGDLSARLLEILNLSSAVTPRQVLTVFNDEVLLHLNRVLSGQIIVPRDLGELKRALQGKTLTAEEARRIVLEWLQGSAEDDEEGDELYEFEE
ncbi:MAG: hypothetical protein J7M26_06685, partial [Armatimonadetes bacterium]|nr:hypothetical protein [Armatimonadota bacterium]